MNQSENINELVTALAKAQGSMQPAVFNKVNPHFKSKFADFTSCMDACRKPLSDNGLAVMQYCENIDEKLNLTTLLAHSSGQWIKSQLPLTPKNWDCQSIGSAMSYAKRYTLSALLGIVTGEEDDDGEAAVGRVVANPKPMVVSKSKDKEETLSIEQIKDITTLIGDDEEKLERILAFYKVDSLANIPVSLYEIIIKRLNLGAKQ